MGPVYITTLGLWESSSVGGGSSVMSTLEGITVGNSVWIMETKLKSSKETKWKNQNIELCFEFSEAPES